MSSYAQDVKNELARIFGDEPETLHAEFAALLFCGAKIFDGRLEFATTNAAVARKVISLAKKYFPAVKPEVAAVRRKKLNKDMSYAVRIFLTGDVQNFLEELDAPELLKRSRFKVAWLRGAFLAKGTVNRPEAQYLLQIVVKSLQTAEFVRKILAALDFNAGLYQRKKNFVVWLREADTICDFLGMIGATNAVERFEVARNLKEVRLQVNRLVNIDTSALNRAAEASQRQIADIKILLARNYPVTKKIREAMELRLANPSCNISELAEKISLSKAGMWSRFKKIQHLAKRFRK
ncbi:MAG: DNA-binding protein WhiA [Selenomonadaceae bacterium]|nr:DNA-binding protein WhiA [Selenomonadaceae bacterium]